MEPEEFIIFLNTIVLVLGILHPIIQSTRQARKSFITIPHLTIAMNNNDLEYVERILKTGLSTNIKVHPYKHLIHMCNSVPMLELLVKHGLDLSKNDPLKYAPLPLFRYLITHYRVPFYKYIDGFDSPRIKFVNKILRKRWDKIYPLISSAKLPFDLKMLVMDFTVPRIKILAQLDV